MLRQKSPKKSLASLSSAKTCLPKTRFSTFFGIRFSTMTYWINGHVSYIKQNSFSIATICKRPHVDKMNGAPAGPNRFHIDKKPCIWYWFAYAIHVQGFFFIDTNAIWSCGRTVHFFDMRSFANCSLWKGILFDIWHMAIYSIRPCRKSDTKKGGKSGFKETSFSRTKICWWLFWWFLSKHAIFFELFICK